MGTSKQEIFMSDFLRFPPTFLVFVVFAGGFLHFT